MRDTLCPLLFFINRCANIVWLEKLFNERDEIKIGGIHVPI